MFPVSDADSLATRPVTVVTHKERECIWMMHHFDRGRDFWISIGQEGWVFLM